MPAATTANRITNEAGSALAFAMLFLLVLTILSIGSMRNAHLDTLLAANASHQADAHSIAEYVMARAQQDVFDLADDPFSRDIANDPFYPASMPPDISESRWSFPHATVQYPDLDMNNSDTDADGVHDDGVGHYIVEDGGLHMLPGEDASVGASLKPLPSALARSVIITVRVNHTRGARKTLRSVISTNQWSR